MTSGSLQEVADQMEDKEKYGLIAYADDILLIGEDISEIKKYLII